MKLIIGLGNVGKQYQNSRHNLGFGVVEMLAITLGSNVDAFKKHVKAPATVNTLQAEHGVILAKPTTMMNLSGLAVAALINYYKIDIQGVLVIHDELDMQFGQMRVRQGGGSAGNNGIKSIIQHVGEDFWRIRLGIANPLLPITPSDKFVLDPFNNTEAPQVQQILNKTADYLSDAVTKGKLVDHTQDLLADSRPANDTPFA